MSSGFQTPITIKEASHDNSLISFLKEAMSSPRLYTVLQGFCEVMYKVY